ncbi:hypothetical protein, partial [Sporisorium scitamineum]
MLTQVSSGPSLPHLLESMRSTESGRRLLIERPSVNSDTVDVEYLSGLERGTFGREWTEWLKENGVGPDGRAEADYMPTSEHKYLIQRYRESHDFYHLLLRMPVTQLGETVVKYFEMAQMNMPVAGFAAAGGTLRILASNLSSLPKPSQLLSAALQQPAASQPQQQASSSADLSALQTLIPWAMHVGRTSVPLISIEWERCWQRNIDDMRTEFGITPPPIPVAKFSGQPGPSRSGLSNVASPTTTQHSYIDTAAPQLASPQIANRINLVTYGQSTIKALIDPSLPVQDVIRQLCANAHLGVQEPPALFALRDDDDDELIDDANMARKIEAGANFKLCSSPTIEAVEMVDKLSSRDDRTLKMATYTLQRLIRESAFTD